MQRPNAIAYIAAFRHNFLRDLNEKIPSRITSEVFAYPFKFLPLKSNSIPRYRPQNLNFESEYIEYNEKAPDVLSQLASLRSKILDNHLPSAMDLTTEKAFEQIRDNGESAWIESIWLEDYEQHFSNPRA